MKDKDKHVDLSNRRKDDELFQKNRVFRIANDEEWHQFYASIGETGEESRWKRVIRCRLKTLGDEITDGVLMAIGKLSKNEKEAWIDKLRSTVYTSTSRNTSFYSLTSRKVFFSSAATTNTVFHETGHAIDMCSVNYITPEGKQIISASAAVEYMHNNGKNIMDMKQYADVIGVEMNGNTLQSTPYLANAKWFNSLCDNGCDKDDLSALSDIFDGLMLGDLRGVQYAGGHYPEYWRGSADIDYTSLQYQEIWADFCELKGKKNTYLLKVLKNTMPYLFAILNDVYNSAFKLGWAEN